MIAAWPWTLVVTAWAQSAPEPVVPPADDDVAAPAPVDVPVEVPAPAPADVPAPAPAEAAPEAAPPEVPADPAPSDAPTRIRAIDTAPRAVRGLPTRRRDSARRSAAVAPVTPPAQAPAPPWWRIGWEEVVPARGLGAAVLLAVLALLTKLLVRGADRLRPRLQERGVLPAVLRSVMAVGRVLVVVLAVAAVVAAVPARWLPVVVVVVLFAGAVVAWSLRQAVTDVICGLIVLFEGRPAPGMLVHVDGTVGLVEAVRLRVTWLRDEDGARVAVPNSRLVRRDVRVEDGRYPEVVTRMHLAWSGPAEVVRERVLEAALVSPWRAPGAQPVVRRGEAVGDWEVVVRVLDVRFARDHREAVREVALEALGLDEVPA
ncbi:MAG: mechanosensitive ion channel [Alphaproteobacteria bacterium]|nr:mechanosensitive ion channel [Alphaproteobacteria bacterium]